MRLATAQRRASSAPHGRRGASLMLFVVLVFALMAVAALTIDIGTLRLTQDLMQGAVDSAALEGQRWRQTSEWGFINDPRRRQRAADMVSLVFDDDLDPNNGDILGFGAGPLLGLSGGESAAFGSQLLQVPAVPVYKPVLQPNANNTMSGDIVAGDVQDGPGMEDADYVRSDFLSAHPNNSLTVDGLLVRMRRTGVPHPADDVPGRSSHGPGVPLLFGRGAAIGAEDGDVFNPRRDGLTARATAIGTVRPAWYVGDQPRDAQGNPIPQDPDDPFEFQADCHLSPPSGFWGPPHIGVVPYALRIEFWSSSQVLQATCVELRSDGGIWALNGVLAGQQIGRFTEPLHQLGAAVIDAPLPGVIPQCLDGLIPIYADIAGLPQPRVVGFGNGTLRNPLPGASCATKTVSKLRSCMPLSGTSATFLEPSATLTDEQWEDVFFINSQYFQTDSLSGSVLAAAIRR